MKNQLFPNDKAHVRFTDMQGVQREGVYKKDSNGYTEVSDTELSTENESIYPEDEIAEWEYLEELNPDVGKSV